MCAGVDAVPAPAAEGAEENDGLEAARAADNPGEEDQAIDPASLRQEVECRLLAVDQAVVRS